MSKRVSNKRGRARKTLERSKVKYGYWKRLARQRTLLDKEKEDEDGNS